MRVWEYSGEWDELEQLGAELLAQSDDRPGVEVLHFELGIVAALRGQATPAREHLARILSWRDSQNNQLRWTYAAVHATIADSVGEFAEAVDLLAGTLDEIVQTDGPSSPASRIGFPAAISAALSLGRLADVDALLLLLAGSPRGHVPPYLRAQLARGQGLLAAARDDRATAEKRLGDAVDEFGALGYPYWKATAQTELGALLIDDQRAAAAGALLDDARAVFKRLGASPMLERVEGLLAGHAPLQLGPQR
jgi:hypothetical protein